MFVQNTYAKISIANTWQLDWSHGHKSVVINDYENIKILFTNHIAELHHKSTNYHNKNTTRKNKNIIRQIMNAKFPTRREARGEATTRTGCIVQDSWRRVATPHLPHCAFLLTTTLIIFAPLVSFYQFSGIDQNYFWFVVNFLFFSFHFFIFFWFRFEETRWVIWNILKKNFVIIV